MFDRVKFRKNREASQGPAAAAEEEKTKRTPAEQPGAASEQDNEEDKGFDLLSLLANYHHLTPDAFEAPFKTAMTAFKPVEGLQIPASLSEDLPLVVKARGFEDKPIEIYSDRVEIPGNLLSPKDTRTALLLAIATVSQPEYMQTGVILEGTEEQQLLLAAAAKVVGLPVVNPPKIPKKLLQQMEAELPKLLAELSRKEPRNEATPPKAGFTQNRQNQPAIEPAVNEADADYGNDNDDVAPATTKTDNSPYPLTDEVREALRDHLSLAKGGDDEVTDDEINEFWNDSISNKQKQQILADPQSLIRQVEAQKQQKDAQKAQRRAQAKKDPGFREFAKGQFAANGDKADYSDEKKLADKLDSLKPEDVDALIENYIDDQTKKQRAAIFENPKFRDFAREQFAAADKETDYNDESKLGEKLESLDNQALESLVGKFNEGEQKIQHEKLVSFLQEKLKKEDEGELSEEEVFTRLQKLDKDEAEKLFKEFQQAQAQSQASAPVPETEAKDATDTALTDELLQDLKDFAAEGGEEVPSDDEIREEWKGLSEEDKRKHLKNLREVKDFQRQKENEKQAFENSVTTESILDKPETLTALRDIIADGGDTKDYTDAALQEYWVRASRDKREEIINYQKKHPKPPKPGNKPGGGGEAELAEAEVVEETADSAEASGDDEQTPVEVISADEGDAHNSADIAASEPEQAAEPARVEPLSPAAYEKVKQAVLKSGQTDKRFIRSVLGKTGDDKPANMNKAVTAAQHKMLEEGIIEPKGSGKNQGYRLTPQETAAENAQTGNGAANTPEQVQETETVIAGQPKAPKKTASKDFQSSVLKGALPEEVKMVLDKKGVTQSLYKEVFKEVVRSQDASDSAIGEKMDAYLADHQNGRDAKLQSKLGKDFLLASVKSAMVTHDILKPETTRLIVDENGYKKQPSPPKNQGGGSLPVHLL